MTKRTTARAWSGASGFAIAMALGLAAGPVAAQDGVGAGELEEVIVTARRQSESLQQVPVSVTYVGADAIARKPTFDIYDLAQSAPGLTLNASGQRQNVNFSIRGQNRTGGTLAPAVIPYFAEVALPRLSQGEFYDLQSIQVLKGPQGTLFGKVTGGGAVLLEPTRPGEAFGGYVEGRVGNYDLHGLRAAVDLPIVDERVLLRVAGDVVRRDGYTHNLFSGEDLDDLSYAGARLSLIVRPTERLENYTVLSVNHSDQNGAGTIFAGYNPFDLPPPLAAIGKMLFDAQQARGPRLVNIGARGPLYESPDGLFYRRDAVWLVNRTSYQLTDALTLKYIFGRIRNKERGGSSVVGENLQLSMNTGKFSPSTNFEQLSNEIQLQGRLFADTVDITAGLYGDYTHNPEPEGSGAILFGSQQVWTVSDRKVRSNAGYAQGAFHLDRWVKGLTLDAGVRYSEDSVKALTAQYLVVGLTPRDVPYQQCLGAAEVLATRPGVIPLQPCARFEQRSDAITYTLGLNYQVNEDLFLYGAVRRGYRPGGINSNGSGGGSLPIRYRPEYVLSREVGVKAQGTVLGGPARLNVAAFWDHGRDIQQSVLGLSGGTVSTPVSGVANAAETRTLGVELDGLWTPVEGLTLRFGWAFTDSEFGRGGLTDAQIAAACPADPLTTAPSANGLYCPEKAVPLTPRHAGGFGVRYVLPTPESVGELSVSADYYYTGKAAADNSRLRVTPATPFGGYTQAYEVVNLNVDLKGALGQPVDVQFFVTNLFDKTYVQANASFLEAGSLGAAGVFYGPPRMYGVSLRYRFGD